MRLQKYPLRARRVQTVAETDSLGVSTSDVGISVGLGLDRDGRNYSLYLTHEEARDLGCRLLERTMEWERSYEEREAERRRAYHIGGRGGEAPAWKVGIENVLHAIDEWYASFGRQPVR